MQRNFRFKPPVQRATTFNSPGVLLQHPTRGEPPKTTSPFQFSWSLIATSRKNSGLGFAPDFQFSWSLIATNFTADNELDNFPLSILLESYCNGPRRRRAGLTLPVMSLSILLESYCNRRDFRSLNQYRKPKTPNLISLSPKGSQKTPEKPLIQGQRKILQPGKELTTLQPVSAHFRSRDFQRYLKRSNPL